MHSKLLNQNFIQYKNGLIAYTLLYFIVPTINNYKIVKTQKRSNTDDIKM